MEGGFPAVGRRLVRFPLIEGGRQPFQQNRCIVLWDAFLPHAADKDGFGRGICGPALASQLMLILAVFSADSSEALSGALLDRLFRLRVPERVEMRGKGLASEFGQGNFLIQRSRSRPFHLIGRHRENDPAIASNYFHFLPRLDCQIWCTILR
jgi:hypothetical protein